jgi:hypothetical protein
MKYLASGLFLFLLSFTSCLTVPEYPSAPSISFGSVYFQDQSPIDYIYLTVSFKDGDGDLGLSNTDIQNPPFQEFINDSIRNPNHYNIFPVLFRKNGSDYDSIPLSFDGIFPRLREGAEAGPIEGSITYKLGSFNFFGEDSSIAKIRVYIQDRALNKSNRIETPPFPVVYR